MRRTLPALLLTLLPLGGQADPAAYRQFDGPHLAQGRAIWLANCEGCHGYGTAGAPVPMIAAEWRDRLQQTRETLYRHAIEGFFGPDDTMMPPRGGNDGLSDEEVRAAVDYMATLAHSYVQQAEQTR